MSVHQFIVGKLAYKSQSPGLQKYAVELLAFGYQQSLACLFPVFIFAMLWLSHYIQLPYLYRYDVLLLACLGMQAYMYFTGMETKDELKVITLFHLLGLAMEIYKVQHGSWAYPEQALTKIAGVPLYSGFMYASVASYICQAWRRLSLNMVNWPKKPYTILLGAGIYLNFFTNAYLPDIRWIIVAVLFLIFSRTWVEFNSNGPTRKMPMILGFYLVGFFIWLAENIATFLGAWRYAYQHIGWQMVHFQKLSSWFLLVIVSIIIVAHLKFTKEEQVLLEK